MFILGMQGMPRRCFDYLPQFAHGQQMAGIGAAFMVAGLLLMVYNLVISIRSGMPCGGNPWGGVTLEWQTPSPPPLHNFTTTPKVLAYPYDFSGVGEQPETDGDADRGRGKPA
jgi:cytochrome c oxidase subunit 1